VPGSRGEVEGGEEVALALGSNLGDRLGHLRSGLARLRAFLRITAVSPVVESRPHGVDDPDHQRDYLNAVVRGRTPLEPEALLVACLDVEKAEGRVREGEDERGGRPRTLDVDIVFHGDRVLDGPGLRIPHPRWAKRGFVLVPLRAVAPRWRDPATGRTVEEVCAARPELLAGVRLVHPSDALSALPDRRGGEEEPFPVGEGQAR